ncbi:hypothetical protein O9K51_04729 [Purpureocillium lavendulum]|uniref:Uncharacterized protein n=1 Tax=Purpureocillium lavendulum TaxID=1247861 RepID=A0AB34FZU7_9HYPO|nr:hypothetical protein O9K51_04729 [Purpureocillium lavendulum]
MTDLGGEAWARMRDGLTDLCQQACRDLSKPDGEMMNERDDTEGPTTGRLSGSPSGFWRLLCRNVPRYYPEAGAAGATDNRADYQRQAQFSSPTHHAFHRTTMSEPRDDVGFLARPSDLQLIYRTLPGAQLQASSTFTTPARSDASPVTLPRPVRQ